MRSRPRACGACKGADSFSGNFEVVRDREGDNFVGAAGDEEFSDIDPLTLS